MNDQEGPYSVGNQVYVNAVEAGLSPFNFALSFGLEAPATQSVTSPPGRQPVVTLFFSPEFAKALSKILADSVATYESAFGEIPLPPGIVQPSQTDATDPCDSEI